MSEPPQNAMAAAYHDPESEPPESQLPPSDPPESHEPESEPPELQLPLSDPPESHEPESDPPELDDEPLSLHQLPESLELLELDPLEPEPLYVPPDGIPARPPHIVSRKPTTMSVNPVRNQTR